MAYRDRGGVTVNAVGFRGSKPAAGGLPDRGRGGEEEAIADTVGGEAASLEDAKGCCCCTGGGVEADDEGVETGTPKKEGGTADNAPKDTGV